VARFAILPFAAIGYTGGEMENILASALGDDAAVLAATEKQLLLSRLLARLAHEIRNPLSSLDIHVQLLEEDLRLQAPAVYKNQAGRLDIIQGELHRLESIVKQFLKLAGPSALELELASIDAIVRQVCDLLKPDLDKRAITITTAINCPSAVLADVSQLTQALLNLIINAVQAINNSGRIEVRATQASGAVQISISDSGPGVPVGKMSAIFEPYYTTKADGSGLGLWIAQQIALAHGGNIQAANAPSGGAVFTLKMPLKGKDSPNG
jgi:two-component system sensor histidine kinase HydH